jgi:uncharacterized protein
MSLFVIFALIVSGLFVGFINTLAGGGTIISLSLLMFLGLPAPIANGTNRVAVVFQNLVAVRNFKKSGILKTKKGFHLAIPTIFGSLAGAKIAVNLNEQFIEYTIAFVMLVILFFVFFKPQMWLKGTDSKINKKTNWKIYVLFFVIGLFGGFIHVGVGYFLLAALVMACGFNLVEGNAVKNLLVLLYVPFTLFVFVWQDQVMWSYGLIHAVGNMIGAYIASKYAVKWGSGFVRWIIVIVVVVSVADLLNIIDIKDFIGGVVNNEYIV